MTRRIGILSGIIMLSLLMEPNSLLIAQVTEQDSLTLVALYDSTGGPDWTNRTNWLSSPVSQWYGIQISESRVTHIQLGWNNLDGTIPIEIFNLDSLKKLDLEVNDIGGEIPDEIGNLKNLTYLSLRGNQLTGEIPDSIGELTNLTELLLGQNLLDGEIPHTIGNLRKLELLMLNDCQLSGNIPEEIGNLTNLYSLQLTWNQLTGGIPVSIGGLIKLPTLDLSHNQLDGIISPGIGNMSNLKDLNLDFNQLTGEIPSEIGNLSLLTRLSIRENSLTGKIPPEIGNLKQLQYLNLMQNQLTGEIPPEIGMLANLTQLMLSVNQLTGNVPNELKDLDQLQSFQCNSNKLTGLPDLSGMAALTDLGIINNKFTFEDIEPNIGIPSFFYWLQDSVGQEEESAVEIGSPLTISVDVGGAFNQYQWWKDGFLLAGVTTSEFTIEAVGIPNQGNYTCKITNTLATDLTLLSRPIHVSIDETFMLEKDSLALIAFYNSTNGPNWTNQFNWLTSPVSTWFGITVTDDRVTEISLNNNNLSGAIPPEIGDLTHLYNMNLSGNQLTDEIPAEIGNLYTLFNLFLSGNRLTGHVPTEIRRLKSLTTLYINANRLTDLPDLSSMTALEQLLVGNNALTFEDIEPNVHIPSFGYFPQDSVSMQLDTTLQQGAILKINISVGGSANHYQWMKDNIDLSSAQDSSYTITYTDTSVAGTYICKITNTIAPNLTLYSRPICVRAPASTGISEELESVPDKFALYSNYPNPFNPVTKLVFDVPVTSHIQISIYNFMGQKVRTLVNEMFQPGRHTILFDGRDDTSDLLSSGIYFYNLKTNDFIAWKKLTLIR